MSGNNGDSIRQHTTVMTDEGRPSEVRSDVAVPAPEKGGAKVSGARRVLQDHPRKILAILLAVLLGAGYFIRSAFRYEYTDDAQVDGHIMPLRSRCIRPRRHSRTRWPAPQVLASTCRSPPLRRKATSIQQVLRS